jgi:hypothetical protein
MKTLRRWNITQDSPYELRLVADARLCQTSYSDDQSWDILIGKGDEPALALHSKYGFRVGLASLIPMWVHDGHLIYQAQTYHQIPKITAFAPNYIAVEAQILPDIALKAEHLAMTSQVIGGIYTLSNTGKYNIKLRFDIFGHIGAGGKELNPSVITMTEGGHAMALATLPTLAPVVLIENGTASALSGRAASPKIGIDVKVMAGESLKIRWVHAGLENVRQSLTTARRWLSADWQAYLESIDSATEAIPTVQTGNLDWDLVLASSYNRVAQAFLGPTGIFPHETFVAARTPELGYSKRGDGSDHPRMWEGQMVDVAYLITPIMANIAPHMAEAVIRNYVAVQREDGYIDLVPNAAGQKQDLLCTPILARLAWAIYQQTENEPFIKDIFPALQKFFAYWLAQDIDGNGVPEWQHERQTHYLAFPSFGRGRVWTQGADISTVETADLLAYLISEATALRNMADALGENAASKKLNGQIESLAKALETFWNGDYYAYRDRDTDITTTGTVLLKEGIGDQEHILERALAAPNRVIVRVVGGLSHIPKMTLSISGIHYEGQEITEKADAKLFHWQSGQGVYTTQAVFSQVNRIHCEGLSRVYRVDVQTMDTHDYDINTLMPLISGIIKAKQKQTLYKLAINQKNFLRPNGISMISGSHENFDPSSAEGAGGLWLYWQTLIGEGLLESGFGDKVADMVKSNLKMLVDVLATGHEFAQFYHSDSSQALGEKSHLVGIAPLYLLQRLFAIRILSNGKVWIGKTFTWGRSVTIRQHGVYVRRSNKGTKIVFPSGYVVELDDKLKEDIIIIDPEPSEIIPFARIELANDIIDTIPEAPSHQSIAKRIIIEVEHED